ncbi:hypothetical protein Pmani_018678 [Petrolisthes manimaculis]|uniref:Uncharacterized protein n=1 Tax=Petrolisthes manimaculis TaxID=1843537 RepID=A0AAE1U849_9EUCA|nr:hypothetical protein Pmani_018678 [Petrolisthes manimaculis]
MYSLSLHMSLKSVPYISTLSPSHLKSLPYISTLSPSSSLSPVPPLPYLYTFPHPSFLRKLPSEKDHQHNSINNNNMGVIKSYPTPFIDDIQFLIDWGDGSLDVVRGRILMGIEDSADSTHQYKHAGRFWITVGAETEGHFFYITRQVTVLDEHSSRHSNGHSSSHSHDHSSEHHSSYHKGQCIGEIELYRSLDDPAKQPFYIVVLLFIIIIFVALIVMTWFLCCCVCSVKKI